MRCPLDGERRRRAALARYAVGSRACRSASRGNPAFVVNYFTMDDGLASHEAFGSNAFARGLEGDLCLCFRDGVTRSTPVDMSRTIDYLETRSDVDASKIAYYGLSWGGTMGAIMPAVEPRIKANVLYVAGLSFQKPLPEVDQVNYVGRVKQPTLILNGELDFFFPPETSQKPLFELLGTPTEHKKRLVFPGGHSVPRTEMIKESLDWLDKYLGPVR